jgi:DNA-binding NtrC family response regulator
VQLGTSTLDLFASYWWPGNVRQLRNEIQRAVAMSAPGGTIAPDHLSADLSAPPTTPLGVQTMASPPLAPGNLASAVEVLERGLIRATLASTAGNISETARVLGLTRRGLYLKMRRLGLEGATADT